MPENIVRVKYITIYTTTPTHPSHVIINLYIWKHFLTINIWFENIFHQDVSFSPWSDHKQFNSNINSKFLWPLTCWTCYLGIKGIHAFYYSLVIFKIHWTLSSILAHSSTCPYWLHIASWNCASLLLLISTFFAIINTLANTRGGRGDGRVSYSWLPTQYYFEIILNDIPFVNIFQIFLTTLSFELKIINHHYVTTVTQMSAE